MNGSKIDAADEQRRAFATELGKGRQSKWLEAFRNVPRHFFTPTVHQQDQHGQWYPLTWGDADFLQTVYSNTALTTQLDPDGIPTSSSSEPELMLTMLDALEAQAGHKVFELGTGTGYNAALLAYRLGGDNVTTMDVDADLVAHASRRLLRYGCHVVTGDGAHGYLPGAPYDRIIATAALNSVPVELLNQATVGALIVAPIGYGIARLTVTSPGHATGRYLSTAAYFMPRREPGIAPAFDEVRDLQPRSSSVDPGDVMGRLRFPLSLALPGHNSCSWRDEEGALQAVGLWTPDGSVATADVNGAVRELGPLKLWQEVERLAGNFSNATPDRSDFLVSITPTHQQVSYTGSDRGPRWKLPIYA